MYNGILIVDKPQDFTSHDVVAKLRGMFSMRQIGHTGTLDPMATGVLVVLLGKATGASDYLMAQEKEYIAHLRLGIVTDTQDSSGKVLETHDVKAETSDVERAVKAFTGTQEQLPPMYSAIQIGGKRLYDLARNGMEVARNTRTITIDEITVMQALPEHTFEIRVSCSKGTYIRTLCHDIGEKLGCGATMSGLRRVRAGDFTVTDAYTLEEIATCENKQALLIPLERAFARYPKIVLDAEGEKRAHNGAFFLPQHIAQGVMPGENALIQVLSPDNQFLQLGIGGLLDNGQPCIFCKKNFMS